MKIKAITIENFKSISEPVRIEFKPMTLLFGPNSAGKSTIIQALHYIREVLEFRRLDVDKTISGGDFIDLGGFDNFVHGHDTSKKVSFEIEFDQVDFIQDPTSDVIDGFGKPLEPSKDYMKKFYGKDGLVKLSFSVAKNGNDVFVDSYRLNFKNILFADGFVNDGKSVVLYSKSETDGEAELRFAKELICSKTESEVEHVIALLMNYHFDKKKLNNDYHRQFFIENKIEIPDLINEKVTLNNFEDCSHDNLFKEFELYGHKIILDRMNMIPFLQAIYSDDFQWSHDLIADDFVKVAATVAERCAVGTIIAELQSMLYVGPLRTIPPRNYSPQKTFAPSRWSDGLAAWDKASYSSQETIDEVNQWLGKKRLDTGYALKLKGIITLEQDELQFMENPGSLTREDLIALVARLHAGKVPKVVLTQEKDGLEVSLCDVGVGISQTFPVVMASLDKDAKIVIIEQPELHIHPRLQVELGDLFISAATEGKCMIIETHSEHLLLRLLRRIREISEGELSSGALGLAPTELSVNYLEKVKDCQCIRQLQVSVDGDSLGEWPKGFFEERAGELF